MNLAPPALQSHPPTRGRFQHLLSLEDLSADDIRTILERARVFAVPPPNANSGGWHINTATGSLDALSRKTAQQKKKFTNLTGRLVFNLFFEASTRTLTTFAIAATRLSADVQSLNIPTSSQSKGESILDTVANLSAMGADFFIIRHPQSGAADFVANFVGDTVHVVNAGDGRHAHPTQGLLDLYTIAHYKGGFDKLSIVIVGDILHSRVARSEIHGLKKMGVKDLRVVGPATLLPEDMSAFGVSVEHNFDQAIVGVDVVMMLRLQNERMENTLIPNATEYFHYYGLTPQRLSRAKPDAIVLHPGPINRQVEIDSAVADGRQSVILPQVAFGIAVRMAVLSLMDEADA